MTLIGGLEIEVSGIDVDTPIVVGPLALQRPLQRGTHVRPAARQGTSRTRS